MSRLSNETVLDALEQSILEYDALYSLTELDPFSVLYEKLWNKRYRQYWKFRKELLKRLEKADKLQSATSKYIKAAIAYDECKTEGKEITQEIHNARATSFWELAELVGEKK